MLGLVGQNISYSLSPALHNYAIRKFVRDEVYLPFDIPPDGLDAFLDFFWKAGGVGFNVTTPHKRAIASKISGHQLSSVNTVWRGQTQWEAASTDGVGFANALQKLGRPLASFQNIVFIGAGGAVTALIEHFRSHAIGADIVHVLARSAAELPQFAPLRQEQLSTASLRKAIEHRPADTLLIQATNAPQKGNLLEELVPALVNFRGTFVDLVYGNPSALYFEALNRGLPTQDGEPMLIEQARESQRLWWGQALTYEEMAGVLRQELRRVSPQGS